MTHRSAQPYTSTPVEAFEAATDWVNDLGSPDDLPMQDSKVYSAIKAAMLRTPCAAPEKSCIASAEAIVRWAELVGINVSSVDVSMFGGTVVVLEQAGTRLAVSHSNDGYVSITDDSNVTVFLCGRKP